MGNPLLFGNNVQTPTIDNLGRLGPGITVNSQEYGKSCEIYGKGVNLMNTDGTGNTHPKKKQAEKFICELCDVKVTSAITLNDHYKGMGHLKRVKIAEDTQKERPCKNKQSPSIKEQVVEARKHLKRLEQQEKNLLSQIDILKKYKENCLSTHQMIPTERSKMLEMSDPTRADSPILIE